MGKFIFYSVAGTVCTFAVFVYLSLLPHLANHPLFADGFSFEGLRSQLPAFLLTLVVSWIVWWSVSGILSLLLYSVGKFTGIALFILSLAVIVGATICIV